MAFFGNKGFINKTTCWYLFLICFDRWEINVWQLQGVLVAPNWKRHGDETKDVQRKKYQ